jgi:RNA polymerase sigma-70 factor (ECF subfamily)
MPDLEREIGECLDRSDLRGAATLVIRGHGPELRRFVERALRSRDEAAEVMSQFGEDLWRALPGFRRECTVRTWCYRIAWHGVLRLRGRRSRRLVRPLRTTEWSRLAANIPAASARGPSSRTARLEQLHAELGPDDLALLHLRVDEELPWEEIAEVLSAGGERVRSAALRKRFERLKERIAQLARVRGLLKPP